MTLGLRVFDAGDGAWLDAWLPDVAASVGYEELAVQGASASLSARLRRTKSLRAWVIVREAEAVGIVIARTGTPSKASATIELVATPPEHARAGLGMGAAALVEALLRDAGARTLYAPAPAVHGISMYFWIRLGYRPLLRGEWPCEGEGVAWLRRDIT